MFRYVANSSLTIYILATVANHIFGHGKALFNLIFQNFPSDGQHAKKSTFSKKAREKVHFLQISMREGIPKSRPGYWPDYTHIVGATIIRTARVFPCKQVMQD